MHKIDGPRASSKIWGTRDDLPEPVGPMIMVNLLVRILSMMRDWRVEEREEVMVVDGWELGS